MLSAQRHKIYGDKTQPRYVVRQKLVSSANCAKTRFWVFVRSFTAAIFCASP